MDANIQRALNDRLYDKRKIGALEYVSPLTLSLLNAFGPHIDSFLCFDSHYGPNSGPETYYYYHHLSFKEITIDILPIG